jgi:hypothetical protein
MIFVPFTVDKILLTVGALLYKRNEVAMAGLTNWIQMSAHLSHDALVAAIAAWFDTMHTIVLPDGTVDEYLDNLILKFIQ